MVDPVSHHQMSAEAQAAVQAGNAYSRLRDILYGATFVVMLVLAIFVGFQQSAISNQQKQLTDIGNANKTLLSAVANGPKQTQQLLQFLFGRFEGDLTAVIEALRTGKAPVFPPLVFPTSPSSGGAGGTGSGGGSPAPAPGASSPQGLPTPVAGPPGAPGPSGPPGAPGPTLTPTPSPTTTPVVCVRLPLVQGCLG